MATASNGGNNKPAMSNAQFGTRALSAGDWTRIQRLRGAKPYVYLVSPTPVVGNTNLTTGQFAYNSDIAPTPSLQQPYSQAMLIKPVVGTSRIRRTASNWTDYVASSHADFYTNGQAGANQTSITQTLNQVGSGTNDSGSGWANKPIIPGGNAINRMKIVS